MSARFPCLVTMLFHVGEPYTEGTALPRCAIDMQRTAVAVDNMLHDGQSQPGSPQLTGTNRINAVETLGQAGNMLARDTNAMIPDRQ